MEESMRNKNKGFSLVELIVVVLIIGILGVSLAPQVMKWVGRARENTDVNNMAGIETSVSTAYAEYVATHTTPSFTFTIQIKANSTPTTPDGIEVITNPENTVFESDFKKLLDEIMNKPVSPGDGKAYFTVTVTDKGVVTVVSGDPAPAPTGG